MSAPLRHRWAAWTLALLLAAGIAPALQAQTLAPSGDPICATPEPTPSEAQQAYEAVRTWLQQHPAPLDGGGVTIPVAFHVIYSGALGNVPQQHLVDQIALLNETFGPMGYRFVLAIVDRTENAEWFVNAPNVEAQMKQALAVDPAHFLNYYTAQLQGGLLGWAYFPSSYAESNFMHGVVLHYQTLPGGGYPGYGSGDTGVHEVGHYVGLYHTFQDGCAGGDSPPGCETGGDQVCDTPAQAAPTWSCPPGYNSCATGGPDPLNNFMSYAGDACLSEFTGGQATRSLALMSQYRPTIMSNQAAFASPEEVDFEIVGVGASDTQVVRVANLTDDPLEVTSITTDNAVFTADASSLTVPPGSVVEVEVTFTPVANRPETGTLSLVTTAPEVGTLTVALDGTGVDLAPALGLDEAGFVVEAAVGETALAELFLSNEGVLPLEYAFSSLEPWVTAVSSNPGTLAPGEQVVVTLTLSAAGLPPGVYQDLFELRTNDPLFERLGLHAVFAVGGAFPPPALVAPYYGAADVPVEYELDWTRAPGADRYEVEVSPDESFTTIVAGGIFEVSQATFVADAGETFFWRVRSLDDDGAESEWSLPFTFTTTSVVANEPDAVPGEPSALGRVYPNPTRGAFTVPFTLDAATPVTLRVYDVTGRLVASLAEGEAFAAGAHALRWEAGAFPAGVYLVRLTTADAADAQQVVLLR